MLGSRRRGPHSSPAIADPIGTIAMQLIDGLRRLFRRGTAPVQIDVAGETGENGGDSSAPDGRDGGLSVVHRRPKRSLSELQQSYDEIMGLVRRIGDHLDGQTRRTETLVSLMERLPPALDALPELGRHNARLLEMLNDHLGQERQRDATLNDTLSQLGRSSDQQTEVLGLLQQQFDTTARASEQMTHTLGDFSDALSTLATSNGRSTELLSNLSRSTQERESTLIEMMQRTQRWMIGAVAAAGALALAAVAVALWVLLRGGGA
jgi:methyl-accepting chemotaxis protein